MKRISSEMTLIHKGSAILCIGLFALSGVGPVIDVVSGANESPILTLLGICLIWLTTYLLLRAFVFDVADEVWDDGEYLVVTWGRVSERIAMSDIAEVSEPLFFRPRRVTLRFEKRGNFGREITFVPAGDFTLSPFRRSAAGEDLRKRVATARSQWSR
jgi:hypothetical protein